MEKVVRALNFRNSCSRIATKKVKNGFYILFESRNRLLVVFSGNIGVHVVIQNYRLDAEDLYTVSPFYMDKMVTDGILNPDYSIRWSELDG